MEKKMKKIKRKLTNDFKLSAKEAKRCMKKARLKEVMTYSGAIVKKLKAKEIAELCYNFK